MKHDIILQIKDQQTFFVESDSTLISYMVSVTTTHFLPL